eukprot:6480526-Amphidinium_carterae.1
MKATKRVDQDAFHPNGVLEKIFDLKAKKQLSNTSVGILNCYSAQSGPSRTTRFLKHRSPLASYLSCHRHPRSLKFQKSSKSDQFGMRIVGVFSRAWGVYVAKNQTQSQIWWIPETRRASKSIRTDLG